MIRYRWDLQLYTAHLHMRCAILISTDKEGKDREAAIKICFFRDLLRCMCKGFVWIFQCYLIFSCCLGNALLKKQSNHRAFSFFFSCDHHKPTENSHTAIHKIPIFPFIPNTACISDKQSCLKSQVFIILEQQQAISMRLRVTTNRYFSSISEFSFIKEIGVGSFGSVKLALHVPTNKCYAVKIVDIGSGVSQNQGLLLEREINLHATIDHPHIIKLWDTLIQESKVYMIMQLAENGTLFTYQNKHQTISQAQAYKFFSQTLSAIKYMHSKDIMHRDIKPENILLDNAFNVKICDLGWATDNICMKRKTFCGTYEYMAPEMIFQKEYNFSIDIWALGILLYELLHNYAPFPAKSLEEMREKVKLGYYELGSSFSKDLKNLIIEILQFDPDQRPAIAKIMNHPWMQKMRKEIKGQIGKIQSELKGEVSNRAKVERQKMSLMNTNKKHKRFDSLMNENMVTKGHEPSPSGQFVHAFERFMAEDKKRAKKKCKTQGEQSIQKLFTEGGQTIQTNKPKWKKQKENSQSKPSTQLSKTGLTFKGDGTLSNLKMKRIAQKLSQLTNKYPQDKKKARVRPQKQQMG